MFGLFEEEEERKVPEGRWIYIKWHNSARDKCTQRPKVIWYMKGDKKLGEEMYDESKLEMLRGKLPIVRKRVHPCMEEMETFRVFGNVRLEKKRYGKVLE